NARLIIDILAEGKERALSCAIAIECQGRGVEHVRSDVVNPAQGGIVAETAARIQKPEELRGVGLAPLETLSQGKAVVLSNVLIQPQADVVGVGGHSGGEVVIVLRTWKRTG